MARFKALSEEQLCYFSRQFSNMFGLPVRLYREQTCLYTYFPVQLAEDPFQLCQQTILERTESIGYFVYHDQFYYGIVWHGEYRFVTGPVSELPLSEHELKKLGISLHLTAEQLPLFVAEMRSLSGMHLDSLLQALILYNFTVNRTMCDISDLRIQRTEQQRIATELRTEDYFSASDAGQYEQHMRSYSIEQDMIQKVKRGDVDGLVDGATKIPAVSSGNLAPQLLRHQKNFFIRLETIVSRAAIEAGVNPDEVLSAEEKYFNKCESFADIDRIKNLQYHMILDYADRVQKLQQYHGDHSRLVRRVTQYIRSHISEPIRTAEIAAFCGKSRGGLTTEFKRQTGMDLSEFIRRKKIQEAESLLLETEHSLLDISVLLGFSSQSHFTRVFKEIHGITPAEFRKRYLK